MKISDICEHIHATAVTPDGAPLIAGSASDSEIRMVGPIDSAAPGQLTFIAKPEFAKYLATTRASAVIVAEPGTGGTAVRVLHKNPYYAFAKVANLFLQPQHGARGISTAAFVAPTAEIGRDVKIFPHAYVSDKARIGDRVVLYPGVYVGPSAQIGNDSVAYANAVIEHGTRIGERCILQAGCVIGADGFGFAPGEADIAKIPQLGIVRIEDDVEVGSHSNIDRAALGETVIGKGCKIDSHVHVAHNVTIGAHSMLCGMVGIAGSAHIGSWCIIGGHAGIAGHLRIADRITVGGMTGVTKGLKEPGQYLGFPAVPAKEWREQMVYARRMPDLEQRVKELEKRLELQSKPS